MTLEEYEWNLNKMSMCIDLYQPPISKISSAGVSTSGKHAIIYMHYYWQGDSFLI